MKNKKEYTFFYLFLFFIIFIFFTCFLINKKYDPFYKHSHRDQWDKYNLIQAERFINIGLIKNFDYDALLIGSSMIENFDMDYFRNELNCNAIKVPLSGINVLETQELLNFASERGAAKKYYFTLDISKFADENEKSRFADYLLNEGMVSEFKYALNYESWYRFYPVNIFLSVCNKIKLIRGINLYKNWIDKEGGSLDIDNKDNWATNYVFDEKIVLDNYLNNKYSVSEINLRDLKIRMCKNIDSFLEKTNFDDSDYNIILPPYSILFWKNAQKKGYFSDYLEVVYYLIFECEKKGINVYNFQTADLILNLNNYKDTTHYSPEINNWMVDELKSDNSKYLFKDSYELITMCEKEY